MLKSWSPLWSTVMPQAPAWSRLTWKLPLLPDTDTSEAWLQFVVVDT